MNSYFSSIAEDLNSNPCPYCGKFHKVEVNFSESAPNLQPILFYKVSEDSCDSFRELVKNRLRTL